MNKKLLSGLAALVTALVIIIGGSLFFVYSVDKVTKKITLQKTMEQPTDTLPAIEKTDTTNILSSEDEFWWFLIRLGQ